MLQGKPRVPDGEPAEFQLPSGILRDRPPVYEQVKRNVWTASAAGQRPKRLPKDDIEVCCCAPPRAPPPAVDGAPPQVCNFFNTVKQESANRVCCGRRRPAGMMYLRE